VFYSKDANEGTPGIYERGISLPYKWEKQP
jgi:hypothetical protein